jgi:hypothetical protein
MDDREGELVGGVEGHLGVGVVFALGDFVFAAGYGDLFDGLVEFYEGGLGGVADDLGLGVFEALGFDLVLGDIELSLTTDHRTLMQAPEGRIIHLILILKIRPLILLTISLPHLPIIPQILHRHLILRQRPSLIRTDTRRRTESLHGFEVLHEHLLFG